MTILGNLGDNPKMTIFDDGNKVVKLVVATNSYWKDKKSGEQKEDTEWHTVYLRGRMAEVAQEYLKKGNKVYLRGKMRTRKYVNEKQETHWITEIHGNQMFMVSGTPASKASHESIAVNTDAPVPQQDAANDVNTLADTDKESSGDAEVASTNETESATTAGIDGVSEPNIETEIDRGSIKDNELDCQSVNDEPPAEAEWIEDDLDIEVDCSNDLTDEFNRKAQAAAEQDETLGISDLPDWLIP